jgi:hypothetical protein
MKIKKRIIICHWFSPSHCLLVLASLFVPAAALAVPSLSLSSGTGSPPVLLPHSACQEDLRSSRGSIWPSSGRVKFAFHSWVDNIETSPRDEETCTPDTPYILEAHPCSHALRKPKRSLRNYMECHREWRHVYNNDIHRYGTAYTVKLSWSSRVSCAPNSTKII